MSVGSQAVGRKRTRAVISDDEYENNEEYTSRRTIYSGHAEKVATSDGCKSIIIAFSFMIATAKMTALTCFCQFAVENTKNSNCPAANEFPVSNSLIKLSCNTIPANYA